MPNNHYSFRLSAGIRKTDNWRRLERFVLAVIGWLTGRASHPKRQRRSPPERLGPVRVVRPFHPKGRQENRLWAQWLILQGVPAIRPRSVAQFWQPNVPNPVLCYLTPNLGSWSSRTRIAERPRMKGTGPFWDCGGDESQAVPEAGELGLRFTFQGAEPQRAPTAQSRKPNENKGFTNSRGEPQKAMRSTASSGARRLLSRHDGATPAASESR